jgi:parvulin-like peptidyl-prolyl isomerase
VSVSWILLGVTAHAQSAPVADRIAAVVNDEVVALSEVYELGNDFIRQRCPGTDEPCTTEAELEVLDALIRRSLIHQELQRLDLDVSASDVDQAIDRTAQQYGLDRQTLKTEVEASGKRWDQYREELFEFLRTQNFQGRVLAPRVTVTDDEVRDYYNDTARQVVKPMVRVSVFGVALPPGVTPEQEAQILGKVTEVVADLNAQKLPWEEAVRLYDAGVSGVFKDEFIEPGTLAEPLPQLAATAPVGVVQPPVKLQASAGHILVVLRVNEKTERSAAAPFEEVKEELRNKVFEEKLIEAEEEWYQRARREAAVDVKLKT